MELYKLKTTPNGNELKTYMAAILEITGMGGGTVFPLNKFFSNFSGHIKAGRIEKVSGGYRLTDKGEDYFQDRYQQKKINRADVDVMVNAIKTGNGAGEWEHIA